MASSGGQASQGGLGGFGGLPRPHGGRGGLGVGVGGEDQGDFEGFAPMSNFSYAVGSRARIDTRPLASAAKTEVLYRTLFRGKAEGCPDFFVPLWLDCCDSGLSFSNQLGESFLCLFWN